MVAFAQYRSRGRGLAFTLAFVLGTITSGVRAAVPHYTIADLGTLPGFNDIEPQGLSSNGQYVIGIGTPSGIDYAYYWNSTTPTQITSAAPNANGNGVNSSGVAVGSSSYAFGHSGVQGDAWTFDGSTLTNLDPLLGNHNDSFASGINNGGVVVGSALNGSTIQAYKLNGSTATFLAGLGSSLQSGANSINTAGEIVGTAYDASSHAHAVIFNGTLSPTDIGSVPGATDMQARWVSDAGQITGIATIGGNPDAFLYTGTTPMSLGNLGGGYSTGRGVNSTGLVVGASRVPGGALHAFVDDGTTMYDLNTLLTPPSTSVTWATLIEATGINDNGQIVGRATWTNGETHAYLLTPVDVPEPAAAAAIIVVCGVVLKRPRRGAGPRGSSRTAAAVR
jgi:probable HAF family extracellular repeat protein